MTDHAFFERPSGLTLREIAALTGAELEAASLAADSDVRITGVAPLDNAGPSDLSFFDNAKYAALLAGTRAGVCLIGRKGADQLPPATCALRVRDPYKAFVTVAQALYPGAMRPGSWFEAAGTAPGAIVHSTARLESGVTIEPGAVIGPRVEIGTGTVIGSGAVIGAGVKIGRDCSIGPTTAISNTYVGNRVIIHPGCKIGQDGFGYVSDASGHHKVPQIGRVIIQNDVEIGAGTMVDRGGIRDTVIGEGTKIDNLVQIGHNAMIGRHCIVVAQSGISGSATLKDGVVLGARAGVNNHVTIGEGAQIAGTSIVNGDVPANARWGGVPAKPVKQWFREIVALERLAAKAQNGEQSSGSGDRSAGKDEG